MPFLMSRRRYSQCHKICFDHKRLEANLVHAKLGLHTILQTAHEQNGRSLLRSAGKTQT
ncbi:hypothetical protein Plhal304r1_c003g0013891 [Plasmopara halstedii]